MLGIAIPAVLHGCFDFVGDHLVGIVVAALAYLLLISYIDRSQEMLAQLQDMGAADTAGGTSGSALDVGHTAQNAEVSTNREMTL